MFPVTNEGKYSFDIDFPDFKTTVYPKVTVLIPNKYRKAFDWLVKEQKLGENK